MRSIDFITISALCFVSLLCGPSRCSFWDSLCLIVLFLLTAALSTMFLYHKSINASHSPSLIHWDPELLAESVPPPSHFWLSNLHILCDGVDCSPPTACTASSLLIFFSLKLCHADVIFSFFMLSLLLETSDFKGQSRQTPSSYGWQ